MQYDLLDELVFKTDTSSEIKDTVILPLLAIKGITHAISLGPHSRNMAESFNFDASDITARQTDFLKKNGFAPFSASFISGVPRPEEPKILDIIKPNSTAQPISLPAEAMFTQLPATPLIHKPADCPTLIMYGLDGNEQPVLGLVHLGRPQVNNRVTEQTLEHLTKKYQLDFETLIIGISPSIHPQHYFIKQKDQEEKKLIDMEYWGKFASPEEVADEKIIRLDVLHKILSVLTTYGIPPHAIQAYGHTDMVDTYTLAAKKPPEAFSHRYATSTNQPEKNGRILVACQL